MWDIENMPDAKIIVTTHKSYRMPNDSMYYPLHVGKANKQSIGFQGDDCGENISTFNARLCELTGLYWAWKNLSADYIGLVHYRRHFTTVPIIKRLAKDKFNYIINFEELDSLLEHYSLILPKQRRYYIETIRSHYEHAPCNWREDVETLRSVIEELEPSYLNSFDKVMNRTHAHMFNMFIMKSDILNRYCSWLFPILFEVDRRIDVTGRNRNEARTVAYFGEFMIDIWNDVQGIPYKELPVIFMEKQNWLKKGSTFLLRAVKRTTR